MSKINNCFTIYSDSNLEKKASLILLSLTGNTLINAPDTTLTKLNAGIVKFSTALVAAAGLGRTNVALKNAARVELEQMLVALGQFVTYAAVGDEVALTSSGYTLSKTRETRYITSPGAVTLANGITSGQMTGFIKSVKSATGYVHEIATELPTEDTVWTTTPSSRCLFTFKDLVPGKQYWIRIAAVGSGEQLAYSPVASQFAQ
ncbi:MAG TPA: fibronectin type III domain-containing protein [Methylotenera sp.]|nr:fibronectin type III domain-containing protein [Methylotenera sp.]